MKHLNRTLFKKKTLRINKIKSSPSAASFFFYLILFVILLIIASFHFNFTLQLQKHLKTIQLVQNYVLQFLFNSYKIHFYIIW